MTDNFSFFKNNLKKKLYTVFNLGNYTLTPITLACLRVIENLHYFVPLKN